MKPRLRPWYVRLLEILLDTFTDAEPKPRVVNNSLARTRRLQRRAAREANRTPFTAPARSTRVIEDRGFQ